MNYITYRRFKREGIDGFFNIPYNVGIVEQDGFLFYQGRAICATTSENGWEHFRPDTAEGAYRQEMLDNLYRWYSKNGCGDEFAKDKWPNQTNYYWKNLLRTSPTGKLEKIYLSKFDKLPTVKK